MIVLAILCANFLYSQDFIWAKAMGGSNVQAPESARSSSVDAAGNIYTTGAFGGTVDFDPGGGVFNMGCNGCQACCNPEDIFITKLDAAEVKFTMAGPGSKSAVPSNTPEITKLPAALIEILFASSIPLPPICFAQTKFPEASSLEMNASKKAFAVKLKVPALGSKSVVPLKKPELITFPFPSTAIPAA